jgi:hypothetical protein
MFTYYLQIADINIAIISKTKVAAEDPLSTGKFRSFLKADLPHKADVILKVEAVEHLPLVKGKKILFKVKRNNPYARRKTFDWSIYRLGTKFLLSSRSNAHYNAVFNHRFTRGEICVEKSPGAVSWKMSQLLYGLLQLVVMHYLAIHKLGVLVHSSGIRSSGKGFMFSGKSGAGKSTSARLWKAAGGVEVLNDDRIIIRQIGSKFYIYGTPWHGDFSDYHATMASRALLKGLFFIYHYPENSLKPLSLGQAFQHFFPNIFPIFWNKDCMDFTAHFMCGVLAVVPAYSLGFVKEQSVVKYVRAYLGL